MPDFAPLLLGPSVKTSLVDTLEPLSLPQLVARLRQPDSPLAQQVQRLRRVRSLNDAHYQRLKTDLPYVVGVELADRRLRTENFRAVHYLVLDIHGLSSHHLSLPDLRKRLATDGRILLLFASPSGEGLKAVFRLQTPLRCTKQYSDFFVRFAHSFAQTHHLAGAVDMHAHDAMRVCFLSSDPQAHYFSDAQALAWAPDAFGTTAQRPAVPNPDAAHAPPAKGAKATVKPTPEVYAALRRKLNPKARPARPHVMLPRVLEEIAPAVVGRAQDLGVGVREVYNISHAKKFVFELGTAFAEILLYYGQNGFTVVKTPKRGHDAQLTALMADLVREVVLSVPVVVRPALPPNRRAKPSRALPF